MSPTRNKAVSFSSRNSLLIKDGLIIGNLWYCKYLNWMLWNIKKSSHLTFFEIFKNCLQHNTRVCFHWIVFRELYSLPISLTSIFISISNDHIKFQLRIYILRVTSYVVVAKLQVSSMPLLKHWLKNFALLRFTFKEPLLRALGTRKFYVVMHKNRY